MACRAILRQAISVSAERSLSNEKSFVVGYHLADRREVLDFNSEIPTGRITPGMGRCPLLPGRKVLQPALVF
jgi:hypothetical protein